jgi:hypothetical protein
MKRITCIFILIAVMSVAIPAGAVTVGGLNFADNAFADTLISAYGDFTTGGGTLVQVLTDSDPGTYAASRTSGAFVQLGFTDSVIINGSGADLALFDIGRPDTFKLTIGGITRQYTTIDTVYYSGPYKITVALVDLDDFGVPAGAAVDQITVGLDYLTGQFPAIPTVPAFSLAGALNSAAPGAAQPPVANAGPNQTVHVGSMVLLDGGGSSDPGGNLPLSYLWEIKQSPLGSQASLSDSTLVSPTFMADKDGDYQLQLSVTNSLNLASAPATVTISTTNSPPVAVAGPDQAIEIIGTLVTLDGSQSYDADGDPLTYAWTLVAKPASSLAVLDLTEPQKPTFVADVHGEYQAQLVVSDPWSSSQSAIVNVSFLNVKPVAVPGNSQSAVVGDTVTLNGSGSSDANGDALTYAWAFASLPNGSGAALANPYSAAPTFVPDLPGTYVVQVIVNDGLVNSAPGTVNIEAVTLATKITGDIQNLLQAPIMAMNPQMFQNANLKNTLLNKLNSVIASLEAGSYQDALGQLQHDILGKIDGCATGKGPDKNDWIKDCKDQGSIYPYLMEIIAELEGLSP